MNGFRTKFTKLGLAFAMLIATGSMALTLASAEETGPVTPLEKISERLGLGDPESPTLVEGDPFAGTSEGPLTAEDIDRVERENKNREEALRSPKMTEERLESHDAFTDSSPSQAKQLMKEEFTGLLTATTGTPADSLADADDVLGFRDDSAALIDPEGPTERSLLESTTPLRIPSGKVVDLSLERSGDVFMPEAATSPVRIPVDLNNQVEFVDQHVNVSLESGPDSTLADITDTGAGDDRIAFYADTDTDTDTAVAPVEGGFETFHQLRSTSSPEWLTSTFHAPAGARLEQGDPGEIVLVDEAGDGLATVNQPFALDAQGRDVPVEMKTDGLSVLLKVEHRGKGFAYPILVDPVYQSFNWSGGQALDQFGAWAQHKEPANPPYTFSTTCNPWISYSCENSGRGLFVFANAGSTFTTGALAQWVYNVPNVQYSAGDAAIMRADLWGWRYWRTTTSPMPVQPYGYQGLHGHDTPPGSNWKWLHANTNGNETANGLWQPALPANDYTAKKYIVGMGTIGQVSTFANAQRYIRLDTIGIELKDGSFPVVVLANPSQIPDGWISGNSNLTVDLGAGDLGLGIRRADALAEKQGGGTYTSASWYAKDGGNNNCTGTNMSICPVLAAPKVNVDTSQLAEGERTVAMVAYDALDKPAIVGFPVRIDRSAPQITAVTGTAKDNSKAGLELKVEAVDGNPVSASTVRSGVKQIKVYVDNEQVYPDPDHLEVVTCDGPWNSCPSPMEREILLPYEVMIGEHDLRVEAIDQLGNVSTPVTWTEDTPESPTLFATGEETLGGMSARAA